MRRMPIDPSPRSPIGDFTQAGGDARDGAAPRRDARTSTPSSAPRTSWPPARLGVLQSAGRRVPEDVAVVGYDDSPIATATRPALTSIRQPIEEMGREMVNLLAEHVEHARRASLAASILATELIRRASSAEEGHALRDSGCNERIGC